jgi:LysM repeat protein
VNTLKSTAVILVLAGVLYGVYTTLNKQETAPPPGMTAKDIDDMGPPQVDFGGDAGQTSHLPAPPTTLTPPSTESPASGLHSSSAKDSQAGSLYAPRGRDSAAPPSASPPAPTAGGGSTYNQQSSFESADAASPAPSPSLAAFSLRRDLAVALKQIEESKLRAALATLSPYYSRPELSPDDRAQLIGWLDALAAKVIYSREHLLDAPYQVRGSETLFDIAERSRVPAELLQNINGVNDPRVLLPNTTLKLVPGPMRAEVNLATSELTLYLGDLYAGRFPFTLGNEPPQPGDFEVKDRQPERTYYGPDGRTIAANDPTNPYGQCWIDLGPSACIHGSPLSAAPGAPAMGCISLSPQDARDVYSILGRGARVVVKR